MQIYIKTNHIGMHKDEIICKISTLSIFLQNKISSYNSLQKQQGRIEALLLLEKVLKENQLNEDKYNLEHLKYNKYGKPFFDTEIDFSISYSDEWVFLGFVKNGIIGIDVEKEKQIDYTLYKDYFTANEWDIISSNILPESLFLKFWTRKEAVAKALGYGAFLEFSDFEVIENLVTIKGISLRIETQFIGDKYWLSVATNIIYDGEFSLI
ncbi:4'-phosphopantetheinyl transferase family protein [Flavobacterium sp.]|uniref:4'-phosphopantetheinyl transferase family protein n=1 Tax=Flavobacterium sp. TaxID=239 RepID=UPI00378929D5